MTRWFDLAPCAPDFVDTAPFRYTYPMDLAAPADRVWAELTAERPLGWCRLLSHAHYTSDRPYGVDTNRTVAVLGLLRLRERFIHWDDTHRHKTFFAVQASLPLFRRFAEDYRVEPAPSGCRFTWTFAFEAGPLGKPLGPLAGPVNAVVFAGLVRDTRRHFGTP